jgi:hypothetical protein
MEHRVAGLLLTACPDRGALNEKILIFSAESIVLPVGLW